MRPWSKSPLGQTRRRRSQGPAANVRYPPTSSLRPIRMMGLEGAPSPFVRRCARKACRQTMPVRQHYSASGSAPEETRRKVYLFDPQGAVRCASRRSHGPRSARAAAVLQSTGREEGGFKGVTQSTSLPRVLNHSAKWSKQEIVMSLSVALPRNNRVLVLVCLVLALIVAGAVFGPVSLGNVGDNASWLVGP